MNFLNKKYTSLHGNAPFNPTANHSHSRSFLPSSSTIRDSPSHLSSNNCETHPSEIVRHMCLDCVELLCSECIGEHLEMHREDNVLPKVVSIRQLKGEMEHKIEHIVHLVNSQNPQNIELDSLKKHVADKIQGMRKDLIRAVEDWVTILKNHLFTSLGFEEVAKTKLQMQKLRDEIGMLQQSLMTSGQSSIVKKIYQIDADKLKQGYSGMYRKYKEVGQRADFDILVNWKEIIKSIESNIIIKNKSQTIEEQEEQPESNIQSEEGDREEEEGGEVE